MLSRSPRHVPVTDVTPSSHKSAILHMSVTPTKRFRNAAR
ncbi:hypothetical protein HMPREF3223_00621 [Cutibacterium avidum]|nr:hypothetical protein HMPREF3223_00621 [Cutibacterium avidum]